ncbi:hypothetical protein HBH98_033220 [Parastagonospora nodorum]|nr:hypothetical protein HBI09_027040 [Parastagonospora nodorum]KAH4205266.1 hypothetical protein HBI95_135490 [Parastagonospora nodorum]KAH4351730.1 hypothetical protein HBH98_033220 [Parastagonospora nodorum]KAH4396193.1 hypothetical protein HBH97_017810 [Parastagonospora nodorum]KAH4426940.1 hypothetical protein HBH99_022130 [Parastagonospora nodorum]
MPSINSYTHEDYPYLIVSTNGEMAYKARADYDFAELLKLVRHNNNEEFISKIKKVVFDPFFDGENKSGARFFVEKYKIDANNPHKFDIIADDYTLSPFEEDEPLSPRYYLDMLVALLSAGLPALEQVVLPKVWADECNDSRFADIDLWDVYLAD